MENNAQDQNQQPQTTYGLYPTGQQANQQVQPTYGSAASGIAAPLTPSAPQNVNGPSFQGVTGTSDVPTPAQSQYLTYAQGAPSIPVKAKPPTSVQIFFILTIIGLAITMLIVGGLLFLALMFSGGLQQGASGQAVSFLVVIGLILLAVIAGEFLLAYFIRKGSRTALIIGTVLTVPAVALNFYAMASQGGRLMSFMAYTAASVIFYVLFWTRDRHYFK